LTNIVNFYALKCHFDRQDKQYFDAENANGNLNYLKIKGGVSSSMETGLVCRWDFMVLFLPKRGRPENRPDKMKTVNLYTVLRTKNAA
jgi:hypothetical protein